MSQVEFPMERASAERIASFIDLHAPPRRANVAFVFGTRLEEPAWLATTLVNEGKVDYVVLTGGVNRHTEFIESVEHEKLLLSNGVPEDRIIAEQESSNTGENVVFGLRELAKRFDLSTITSVVAVAKWYHSRRAVMTLKRHLGQGKRFYVDSYEPDQSRRADWYLRESSARPIIKEWQSISGYLRRGWISEVNQVDGHYE